MAHCAKSSDELSGYFNESQYITLLVDIGVCGIGVHGSYGSDVELEVYDSCLSNPVLSKMKGSAHELLELGGTQV